MSTPGQTQGVAFGENGHGLGSASPDGFGGNGDTARESRRAGCASGDRELPQKCAVCDKIIPPGGWFCRLPFQETSTFLCSPRCALRHFDKIFLKTNGDGHDLADGERRLHFFVAEEKLWP